jgi:hypothetical protein
MTTATQVISQALGIIGVKSPGQALGTEAADCLERLNMMLDGWRTERLYATAGVRVSASLNGSTATATIGPTGTFVVTPRPISIEPGSFYTVGSIDYPITPVTLAEYNEIPLKGTTTLGPSWVYYEAGDPNGTLYFFPLLATQATVTLVCASHLSDFADLTTDYDLGPGVMRALVFSFAEEMAPDFERPVPPGAQKMAMSARRTLKRSHHQTPQLSEPRSGLGPDYLASAAATFQSAYADYYATNYA